MTICNLTFGLMESLVCTGNNQSEVTLLWGDIMRRCGAIYPELFTPDDGQPTSGTDANESKHGKDEKALTNPAQQATLPVSVKVVISGRTGILNLAKIRSDLVNSSLDRPHQNARRVISTRRKLVLLQALRWVNTKL